MSEQDWDYRARAAVRWHYALLVPPLAAIGWRLAMSPRIWTDKNQVGRGSGSALAAHGALWLMGVCIVVYLAAPLTKLLPMSQIGMREPSEAEIGCVPVILRALVLIVLYGGAWSVWGRY